MDASKHNLRHALKKAAFDNNLPEVAKAAQAIFEAGYEIEDMGFTPGFFEHVCNQIIKSGFVPKLPEKMIKEIEEQE